MSRHFIHHNAVRFAVILLVALLAEPVAEADDYFFISLSGQEALEPLKTVHVLVKPPPSVADEEANSHDSCVCIYCMVSLDDTFTPDTRPPDGVPGTTLSYVRPHASSYRTEIFHPPIS